MDNWKHTAPPKYNHPFNKRLSDTDYDFLPTNFFFLHLGKLVTSAHWKIPAWHTYHYLPNVNSPIIFSRGSLVAQMVKNLPAMQETQFWCLSWEDPPGEENGNQLQYYCPGITWTEESGKLQSMGSQRVGHNLMTKQQHPFYLNPDFWRVSYVLSSREGTHIPTHLVHPDDTDLASKLQSEVCYYIVLILCVSSYSFSVICGPHPQTLSHTTLCKVLLSESCIQSLTPPLLSSLEKGCFRIWC